MPPLQVLRTRDGSTAMATTAWRPRVISTQHVAQHRASPTRLVMLRRTLRSSLHFLAWNRGYVARSLVRFGICGLALYTLAIPWAVGISLVLLGAQIMTDEWTAPPQRPSLRVVRTD